MSLSPSTPDSKPRTALRSGASTTTLDSPPTHFSTLKVQRQRSNTDNLRERSVSVRISQARGDEEHEAHRGSGSRVKMLIGKGYSWKSAKARLPPPRHIVNTARNPRVLLTFGLLTVIVLLWQSLGEAAGEVQR
jgi:hypothetical protein